MKIRKLAAVSAMTIAALGLAAGTSYADPAPAPAASDELNVGIAPSINYKAYQNGTAAVISTDAGSLTVANGQLQIKDNAGIVVGGLPLLMQLDDMQVPIAAQLDGNTATLTLDGANAVYKPVALPYQDSAPWKTPYEREQAAWNRMTSTIGLGTGVGALVGAIGAGLAGCTVGGLAAAGIIAVPAVIIGPLAPLGVGAGALVGCASGAIAFASAGTLVGALVVGIPVSIAAAIQYFTTINEPMAPKPAG